MAISYNRQFSHKNWIDFVDSVQAGGTNGVNGRFHAIETEFDTLSTVVSEINTALQVPTPRPRTILFPPSQLGAGFFIVGPGAPAWVPEFFGFAATPTTDSPAAYSNKAVGLMIVNLPDGATLQSLRVTGASAGGQVSLSLSTRSSTTGAGGGEIGQVSQTLATAPSQVAFDLSNSMNAVVDNAKNLYLFSVSLNSGNTTLSAGGTTLYSFLITYVMP
jgi:hypothetical protein